MFNCHAMLTEVYRRLFDAFGPQHWWPGESPFEVMVGAVLTQNTNWQNVERAIHNLREADLLEPHALYDVPVEELEELIRPAGYFRVKAQRLRSLLEFLVERYDGSLEAMFADQPRRVARTTARRPRHRAGDRRLDLLYAGGLPSFVVDAYTHRVFARHGWIDFDADYHADSGLHPGRLAARSAALQRVPRIAGAVGKGLLSEEQSEMCRMSVARIAAARRTAGARLGRRAGGR